MKEDQANLNGLSSLLLDPLPSNLVSLVEAQESSLSTSLDELIGLGNELFGEDPVGETVPRFNRRGESVGCRVPMNM